MAKTICLSNQKGGVGKSVTTANLGIGLARQGKKVLLIDNDPQASLSISLGCQKPDELPLTLVEIMNGIMQDTPLPMDAGIIHHNEGVDLIPASIELSGVEVSLVNAMTRETILRQYLELVKPLYDYILIDTSPSLGMLTINALAAADSVLIPVQAEYLPARGLELLLRTVARVRRQINPELVISGILLTMVDERTNDAKETKEIIHEAYGSQIHMFSDIPRSVRTSETTKKGSSVYVHDPNGKVAAAYETLTREVLSVG